MNQQPAYPQYPAQGAVNFPYPPTSYGQQQAPYANTVQYSVPRQHPRGPYYPAVAPSAPLQQAQQQTIQSSPTSTRRNGAGAVSSSVPGTPDNGPGAPPPDPNSPSMSQYAEDLAGSLRRDDPNDVHVEDESGDAVFHLPPPPENTYTTDKELETAMHAWSLEHGYELVRRASKKNAKGVLYKRYYHCSKHGKLANTGKLTEETRVRVNRKSNRIGCPMSLAVVAMDPANTDGPWQIRHRKTHHNHGPLDALALTGHRRRARVGGVEKAVDGLFAIGTPTAQILQFLQRTNPNGLFTRTDVANMKLKYKKYGTCVDRKDMSQMDNRPGFPSACLQCRSRKIKCDSMRPECTSCQQSNQPCRYDHEPSDSRPPLRNDAADAPSAALGDTTQPSVPQSAHVPLPTPLQTTNSAATNASPSASRVEEILANLQSFKTTHVAPSKLTLQSSAVEVLAASSCGSGESYRNVPILQSADQWQNYRTAVNEASMKENTFEVLVGTKSEPSKPADDCRVEEWNEYIKQLAIYNRRNTALLGALLGTLSSHYRARVQHIKKADEMWQVLENLCSPRGSDQALRFYLELHAITQQNSVDLKDYVMRLETAYNAFNRLSQTRHDSDTLSAAQSSSRRHTVNFDPGKAGNPGANPWSTIGPQASSAAGNTSNMFSEEMLCLLFLKNLGPDYRRWIENLCTTNNVAGFGTGPRLGFADITRRAVEFEAIQRR